MSDRLDFVEQLIELGKKHRVMSIRTGDTEIIFGQHSPVDLPSLSDPNPEPAHEEPRGDDGLTKDERELLYASSGGA